MLDEEVLRVHERIQQVRWDRQQELDETDENEPHPSCGCGLTMAEHLRNDLLACDLIEQLILGDPVPLATVVRENGPVYLEYAVLNLYRDEEDSEPFHDEAGIFLEFFSWIPGGEEQLIQAVQASLARALGGRIETDPARN